ncbi:hypothetical protein [Novosphingobium sp. ZW T3_23]|uniref:hypothetical protein n=1 Tax=Novosphingobium sp. ZW T3_23 TaxID=3378084 RepID=UPI003853BCD5
MITLTGKKLCGNHRLAMPYRTWDRNQKKTDKPPVREQQFAFANWIKKPAILRKPWMICSTLPGRSEVKTQSLDAEYPLRHSGPETLKGRALS